MSQLDSSFDPALMAVIGNRLDAILREMTNTLLRSGRSAVLSSARDFSCSLVTADNRLLATAEGIPVHIFGSHLQTQTMTDLHHDISEGDAFLHNDPYNGNTHAADHTILVPVFVGGRHLFTTVAKAHQADIGNSFPTTYFPTAKDVYEEGALIFTAAQIQRDYKDVEDIIRICRSRIRVPDQWYGDYLACLGAARIGERGLHELVEKYGVELIDAFIEEWFDYSERRIDHAIRGLRSGHYEGHNTHDPLPGVTPEDGIPIKVEVDIDADEGAVEFDLRDNPDCVPGGLNMSRATSTNSAVTGLFNVLDPDIPHNHGTFRRLTVHIRENCVVGYPVHPTSCSVATTNVADRVVNASQTAVSQSAEAGLAEGGAMLGAGAAVVAGADRRRDGAPFVNQVFAGAAGGPASAECDGWLTYLLPVTGGLLLRDSVEVDEHKFPILVDSLTLVPDSAGAGKYRGGASIRVAYGPRFSTMTVATMGDSTVHPAKGAAGGHSGRRGTVELLESSTGERTTLPGFGQFEVEPGTVLIGTDPGGGGFGKPEERDPEAVRFDVLEGWVSRSEAENTYKVAFSQSDPDDSLRIDHAETRKIRGHER